MKTWILALANIGSIMISVLATSSPAYASLFHTSYKPFVVQVETVIDLMALPPEITGEDGMALPVSVELAGNTEDDRIVTREAIKLEARDAFGGLTDADWTFSVTQFSLGGQSQAVSDIDTLLNGNIASAAKNQQKVSLAVQSKSGWSTELTAGDDINIAVDVIVEHSVI